MTNSSSGNAIEAYNRASSGSLTPAGTYPTGGDGGTLGSGHSIVVSQDGSVVVNGASTSPGAKPHRPRHHRRGGVVRRPVPYVQAGRPGKVDAYRIGPGESLARTGSVTVPGAAGGESIAAS